MTILWIFEHSHVCAELDHIGNGHGMLVDLLQRRTGESVEENPYRDSYARATDRTWPGYSDVWLIQACFPLCLIYCALFRAVATASFL